MREYGGGCQAPFGALAIYDIKNNELYLKCDAVHELDGKNIIVSKEGKIQCGIKDINLAKDMGIKLGNEIKHTIM